MALSRNILHCLTVATLALGIASAPLYVAAQAVNTPAGATHLHGHLAKVAQVFLDRSHTSTAKPHAMSQTCCHPGCIMAVVPGFAGLTTALLPWVIMSIPRDPWEYPTAPVGIDRPPKHA